VGRERLVMRAIGNWISARKLVETVGKKGDE
jgi:hypothetical protein